MSRGATFFLAVNVVFRKAFLTLLSMHLLVERWYYSYLIPGIEFHRMRVGEEEGGRRRGRGKEGAGGALARRLEASAARCAGAGGAKGEKDPVTF